MFSSIRTSEENREIITMLTYKLQLGTENVIARIALAYSLAQEKKLELKDLQDSKGKEYSQKVLFGDQLPYYVAAICQFYNINKTDGNIPRYIKMHIDNGLGLLGAEVKSNPNQLGFDFLLKEINGGVINF